MPLHILHPLTQTLCGFFVILVRVYSFLLMQSSFRATRESLVPRPWAIDHLDNILGRFQAGRPYHKAVLFVDNAGSDVVLGNLHSLLAIDLSISICCLTCKFTKGANGVLRNASFRTRAAATGHASGPGRQQSAIGE